jgi:phage terminase large subunit-like protein
LKRTDPTTDYASAVVQGQVIAAPLVRKACERHLNDLEVGADRGLTWKPDKAGKAIGFIEKFCHLAEGEFAGKPFILQPWQRFITGSLHGWRRADDRRRFNTAYIEIAKGNGKTPWAAAMGLHALIADGEAGAQVVAAAVSRAQAGIGFGDAHKMVSASPLLRQRVQRNVAALSIPSTHSTFRPVSSEARTLDGLRIHYAMLDELHAHPDEHVADRIRAGTKGRRNPLIVEITNAGFDRYSICYRHHAHSEAVVTGALQDDSWFAFVAGLDEGDDWRDEQCWVKSNPNLGISVPLSYLRREVAEAQAIVTKESQVRRFNFCEWVESETRWISLDTWDEGATPVDVDALQGKRAIAGLDLAAVHDLTALTLLFPADDGSYDLLAWFWHPREGLMHRVQRDRVPYDRWSDDGYLILTDGPATDYAAIRAKLTELCATFDVIDIGVDMHNAQQLVQDLTHDGRTVTAVQQGMLTLSPAVKEVERLVLERKLRHGGHPLLRWCVSNTLMETDAAGNMKPSKQKSRERIDGVSAMATAMARALAQPPPHSFEAIFVDL